MPNPPDTRITVIIHPAERQVILVTEDGQTLRMSASTALALAAELSRLAILAGAALPIPVALPVDVRQ